jgi:hypothetical protein
VRGGLAVVLAVLATVVLVLGVDALGIASDVALLAIDPTATSLSVVGLTPMHVIVAAMPVRVLRHWRAER